MSQSRLSDKEVELNLDSDAEGEASEDDGAERPLSKEEILAKYIQDNVRGGKSTFKGPFGRKELVFCDYIYNGRSLTFLEDFLTSEVYPLLSTDTLSTSVSALQSTMYLDEIRNIIFKATNAGLDDELIFVQPRRPCYPEPNSLAECVVNELTDTLGIQGPVIFASVQVDQGILDTWTRKAGASIVRIPDLPDGRMDVGELKNLLEQHKDSDCPLIGWFAACSDVTSVVHEDLNLTALLHMHGALSIWDYTRIAPYANIDFNPEVPDDDAGYFRKDVLFFSLHNFVGGLQTCNVLLVKKALILNNNKRAVDGVVRSDQLSPGGAGVQKMNEASDVIALAKAGLVMQLKEAVGPAFIMERQKEIWAMARERWAGLDSIKILGGVATAVVGGEEASPTGDDSSATGPAAVEVAKMAVVAFTIFNMEAGHYLHQNFICALLQDLFGIQARSFSALEHSYARDLFGLTEDEAEAYMKLAFTNDKKTMGVMIPGYVQLDVPWFFSTAEIDYIFEAVALIAEEGWRLLPQYNFTKMSGEWFHVNNFAFTDRKCMAKVSYASGEMEWTPDESSTKTAFVLSDAILKVKEGIKNSKKVAGNLTVPDHKKLFSKESLDMRWFMLPTEAKELIFPSMFKTKKSKKNQLLTRGKFSPKTFEVSSADSAVEINPIGTLGGGSVVYPQPLQSAERRKMSNGAAGDGKKAGSSMNWLRGPFNAEEKRAENASKKKEGDAEDNANVLEEPEVQEEDNGASTVEEEPEDVQQQNGTPDENGVGSSEEEPADTEEKKKEEIKPAPPVAKPKKSLFGWFKKAPPPVETAANGNGQESEEESQVNGKAEENGSEENGVGGGGGGGADDEEPRAEVVATENVKVSEMDPGLRIEIERAVANNHRRSLEVIMELDEEENEADNTL